MGNAIRFRHTNGCSCESIKVFETENLSTWGELEPPTFGFMPNALTIWAIRARHLMSHVFEYWLWWYRYLSQHLKCKMRAGNSIHLRHTNGCSCESVKVFETENVSTRGRLEPPTLGFILNDLTIWAMRARHLMSHVWNTGSGGWWFESPSDKRFLLITRIPVFLLS